MTTKLVNKGSVMGNTLKEKVDRLIAKSNQEPQSSQKSNPPGHSTNQAPYGHGPTTRKKWELEFCKTSGRHPPKLMRS